VIRSLIYLIPDFILGVIERLKIEGTTILLVEQNAQAALSIADRGYVLETGRVTPSDTGPSFLMNKTVQQAYLGM
jgi:branched-chain amino acid transport system ATP-binding protein